MIQKTFLICLLIFFGMAQLGCSQMSWGYRFADWAVEGRVDDYLDLTSKQKKDLEIKIDEYFVWHKKTMMPRYADLLSSIHERVNSQQWGPEQ